MLRAVEVYIYDFDSDIYGSQVTLKLIDFIREDRKIDGLDALKAQMEEDKEAGRRLITGITPSSKNLAVVVLNYNGAVHLRKYMPDLIKYSPQADIVLADNCSTDDSLDYLKTLEKGHKDHKAGPKLWIYRWIQPGNSFYFPSLCTLIEF